MYLDCVLILMDCSFVPRYCSGSLYPRTLLRLSPRIPVVILVTPFVLSRIKGPGLAPGEGQVESLVSIPSICLVP